MTDACPPIIPTLRRHFTGGDPIRSLIVFHANTHKQRGLRIQGWTSPTLPRFFFPEEAPSPAVDVHWVCEGPEDGGSLERILTNLGQYRPASRGASTHRGTGISTVLDNESRQFM
jgi:hypothetical protein